MIQFQRASAEGGSWFYNMRGLYLKGGNTPMKENGLDTVWNIRFKECLARKEKKVIVETITFV